MPSCHVRVFVKPLMCALRASLMGSAVALCTACADDVSNDDLTEGELRTFYQAFCERHLECDEIFQWDNVDQCVTAQVEYYREFTADCIDAVVEYHSCGVSLEDCSRFTAAGGPTECDPQYNFVHDVCEGGILL